jgi:molecular chaperone DnaK
MASIIGIDLGTTSSRVAVVRGRVPTIIENAEGEGTTPSYVAFTKSGEILVGEAARRQAVLNHENTIYAVERLIGRRYDDSIIEPLKRLLPYKIVRADNGDAWVEVRGRPYSPQEISAHIVRKMKETTEAFLGETITQAVITVPAYFNDAQRQATMDAGKIAGLKVLRIINEPTAAALAHGLDETNVATIAVYDLGGGSFDISILEIGDGIFEVKSTNGDTFLGGEDFDIRLVGFLVDQFAKVCSFDLRTERLALQRIKEAAEIAKIELSSRLQAEVLVPFLAVDRFGAKHLNSTITRTQFEMLTLDLVERTIDICGRALKDAGMSTADVSEVVMVGGSTRIPLVSERVSAFFGKQPHKGTRREDAVALGAAIQAGILSGQIKHVLLLDVIPLSIGIETLGGAFTRIIDRNTTVPTKRSQVFSTAEDNQKTVTVSIYQGERDRAAENKLLSRFDLDGIEPAGRGSPEITVTFDIDANGVLMVSAKNKKTGKEQSIRVHPSGGLLDEEIQKIISGATQSADSSEDRTTFEQVDKPKIAALPNETERSYLALITRASEMQKPTLFVEGITDRSIIATAWSVFFPHDPMPFHVLDAGGTKQMASLAGKGKALRSLLGDRVVFALVDNDLEGRALIEDGHIRKGGVWRQLPNGIHWCLLKPTEDFLAVMKAYNIPPANAPFTIEAAFAPALRRQAEAHGAWRFSGVPQAELLDNADLARRLFPILQYLGPNDAAYWYLMAPHPDAKETFAAWITDPSRRTKEHYAAFEEIIIGLRALLNSTVSNRSATVHGRDG